MEKFKSFITEESGEKYNVLIISTEHGEKSITADRLQNEAKKLGLPYYTVKMNGTHLQFAGGKYTIHKDDDKKGFVIDRYNTVCFMRGTPSRDSYLDLVSQIEKIGIPIVNSRLCIDVCADKYRTYLKLKDFGLDQPKTELCPSAEQAEESFKNLDTKYPIILKTLRGSKGIGVLFVETERSLSSLVQTLYKVDTKSDLLIQEYIKTDHDIRAIVLDGKVIAVMRRDTVKGDFRSNASQGAEVKPFKLTKLETDQCVHAAKAVGGVFTGVDFIPSKNRETENPKFLEVNSSPGTEGIEDASGLNISKIVLEYFMDVKNRYPTPTECGYYESITINPFGSLVGKFDTGNSKRNVLHAEDVKVVGDKITFTLNGKTVTTRHYGTYVSVTGGGEDKRYIVKFDMEFTGTLYKGVEFGLDNRERMGTEVLLNRQTMNLFNVVVSPRRKYMVTTKSEIEEKK